jgi:thiol:disulfide interchange protein
LGFALPLLLSGVFAEAALRMFRRFRPQLPKLERAIGALLIVVAGTFLFGSSDNVGQIERPGKEAPGSLESSMADARDNWPTMLELYSEDCSICREMKPVVARIADQCHEEAVLFRSADVSKPANRDLLKEHRVVGVPTYVFLDQQGTEVARLVGKQSEEALAQGLSALVGESCPGIGPIPELPDVGPKVPVTSSEAETLKEETCSSTSLSAMPVEDDSTISSASASEMTLSLARLAKGEPNVCSLDLP